MINIVEQYWPYILFLTVYSLSIKTDNESSKISKTIILLGGIVSFVAIILFAIRTILNSTVLLGLK